MSRKFFRGMVCVVVCAMAGTYAGAASAQSAKAAAPAPSAEVARIRDAMKATWDKPGQPLLVDPVVTEGEHGVASWAQGERGGRAVLRRHGSEWKVLVCGGDGLKSAAALKETGVPARSAERLAQALAAAEAKLPRDLVHKFSLFGQTMRMDGHHGAGHK